MCESQYTHTQNADSVDEADRVDERERGHTHTHKCLKSERVLDEVTVHAYTHKQGERERECVYHSKSEGKRKKK